MRVDGIASGIDSAKYSELNIRDSNSVKTRGEGVTTNINGKEKRYTEDELIRNIEAANEKFIAYDRKLEFSIHEKTKQIMVKIIDVNTDETIREIPPEKILDMVAYICEAAGLLVDERV